MVIVVEIEDRCFAKPFLGGWRNVVTGTEYHDARTQTCPGDSVVYPRGGKKGGYDDPPAGSRYETRGSNVIIESRDRCVGTDTSVLMTLLASYRCKRTSLGRERASQTSRLPDLRDKLVTPLATRPEATPSTNDRFNLSPFIDASNVDERHRKQIGPSRPTRSSRLEEESAMKIQKCYRAYRARSSISALARLSRATRAHTPPKPENTRNFRQCRASRFAIVNLVPPTRRTDFEMILSVLERWRSCENARLDRGLFGTSRLAARSTILRREIDVLRTIEIVKSRVRAATRQRCDLKALDELAESEVWSSMNGERIVRVDTLRVQRARELVDFYRSLVDAELSAQARMEILKKLRNYAALHGCRYAEDLASIVDQEIQLAVVCRDSRLLHHLRNRLKIALLRLTKNSCGSKIDRPSTRRRSIAVTRKSFVARLCKKCGEFFTIDDELFANRELSTTCQKCRNRRIAGEAKIVYEPYEIMIRDLRTREIEITGSVKACAPAWLVEPTIIYRLVNDVWHGKSAISECDDPYRLVLVRFDPDNVWSPWNNLVLTKREAALHRAMEIPSNVYATAIFKRFVVKNLQAKLRFDFNVRGNY